MQIETMLGQSEGGSSLGAQEAAMLVWALAVLHELQPNIWNALLDVLAAAPEESLDEASGLACLLSCAGHAQHLQCTAGGLSCSA